MNCEEISQKTRGNLKSRARSREVAFTLIMENTPLRVLITGAAGNIGYCVSFAGIIEEVSLSLRQKNESSNDRLIVVFSTHLSFSC